MRVFVVARIPRDVRGGMRRHMELHAEGLKRLGHDATVFYREDFVGSPAVEQLRMPGLASVVRLWERCRRAPPDVVNVHTECAPAWIMARRAGLVSARVVVMSYAADEPQIAVTRTRDALRWARIALPARLWFPRADGIWCVNQTDVRYYVEAYGVPAERVVRLPHAVADSFYEPAAVAVRAPRQVLFVGSFIHRKGVDVLTAALETVLERAPDTEVVLAGTQSGEARVRAALGPRLAARARIVDSADDTELRALYRASTLLLVPSRAEGLPIGMLEAMVSGCPPLAAANSGMLDVIVPGKNGWLEATFDPARWAERLLSLLDAPDELQAASKGARATGEAFRIETVARAAVEFYERIGA